ncbi:AAA domain-containing protein [Desulfobacter postgatei]|uniref:Nuclease-like protein,protein kinase family protein n=1 Tax=Desulfobacter postgatei 2ac9 TaxID=879212 RepID=I5B135_9BACT|nr:AAA domain-containing protein [Desulfobacter postgatei]EIM63198.1 nuclease-like protein,protein kinase family protein [Desulfobacter postgatei 2ac9]
MKIQVLNLEGIHNREIKGLEAIEKSFPKAWIAYASLELYREQRGSREFDLVIVTYDRVLAIEIKDWNGELKSDGSSWFLNSESRGKSPVLAIDKKAKILYGQLKKISHQIQPIDNISVEGVVVLTGTAGKKDLTQDEKNSVFTLDDFLGIVNEIKYKKVFKYLNRGRDLCKNKAVFDHFFQNKKLFKPQEQTFHNHQIIGDAIYQHPKYIYKEFQAVDINVKSKALLRLWDLSSDTLPIEHHTQEAKREIVEREPLVLSYIKEISPELFEKRAILEQKSYVGTQIIADEYAELYDLPTSQERLSQFINSSNLTSTERISLIKFMLSSFSDIHGTNVAHRDLGQDCIWASPTKISFSGFMSATLPNNRTIRQRLPILQSNRIILPEHELDGLKTDPFKQDVFLLGVAAHLIAFGEKPDLDDGVPEWKKKENFEEYHQWFEKALSWEPSDRFSNAKEMLDAFNEIAIDQNDSIDISDQISNYQINDVIMAKYRADQTLKKPPPAIVYKSECNAFPVIVKCWNIANDHDLHKNIDIYNFFETVEKYKRIQSDYLAKIIDCGIDQLNSIFMVQEYYEGISFSELNDIDSLEQKSLIALKLIDGVENLHQNEIYHRDIRIENIIFVKSSDSITPIIIDVIEYMKRDYCQNYCPKDYESISLEERDIYAVALVVCEILGIKYSLQNGVAEIQEGTGVLKPLNKILKDMTLASHSDRLTVLGSLKDELKCIVEPPIKKENKEITIQVTTNELSRDINFDKVYSEAEPNLLASDNGLLYVKCNIRKDDTPSDLFIIGMNQEIKIKYDKKSKKILKCWVNYIEGQKAIIASNKPLYKPFEASIYIKLSNKFIVSEMEAWITDEVLQSVSQENDICESEDDEFDEFLSTNEKTPPNVSDALSLSDRWNELIEVEEDLTVEVRVIGQPVYRSEENVLIIPYDYSSVTPDFNENDSVKVLYQNKQGEERSIGELDLNRTTTDTLYIMVRNLPIDIEVINKLTLDSLWQKESFKRRLNATKRILNKRSVIPNLIDLLDGEYETIITREDVEFDEELIERYFGDNEAQVDSFKRILVNRPLGLLQGPPGTGKTKFVAAFVHYLFQRLGISNILLVSQSHEAVNNIGEAIVKLNAEIEPDFYLEMVRVGAEGVISKSLLKYHSIGLKEKYSSTFKAEFKKRISIVGKSIGLPERFVSIYFDVQQTLGVLSKKIHELLGTDEKAQSRTIQKRVNSLRDRFWQIYDGKYKKAYGEPNDEINETLVSLENKIKEKYGISSYPHYLTKLNKLISLGEEWLKVLDSNIRGYEEFLARTRHIIIGTCVGVGKPSLKIHDNMYDWVIIDEAARCNPSELAVSMQVGKNILLVGDHKQLPPMIDDLVLERTSRKLKISQTELKKSEFQRLMESNFGKRCGCGLNKQYRMCKPIADMISDVFYKHDGIELITMREIDYNFTATLPDILDKSVTWIDTSSVDRRAFHRQDELKSLYNPYEANTVISILDQLYNSDLFIEFLSQKSFNEPPIGVICPYAAQKKYLNREILKKGWPSDFMNLLKIDTIDSYQGKENEIIIVSLTRNDKKITKGFLKYPERINVSLSRARERLVIIGATRMWDIAPADMPLRKILEYIEIRKDSKDYGLYDAADLFRIDGDLS